MQPHLILSCLLALLAFGLSRSAGPPSNSPVDEIELARLYRSPRLTASPTRPAFPFSAEAARRYQIDYAHWAGLPVEVTTAGGRLVLVPPGVFRMGSPATESGRGRD